MDMQTLYVLVSGSHIANPHRQTRRKSLQLRSRIIERKPQQLV
jgi:hypothetical protein